MLTSEQRIVTTSKADTDAFLVNHGLVLRSVTKVEQVGEKDVFDITVPGVGTSLPNSFIANGIVTHNSATPEYIENIMRNMGVKADVKSIFGVRDEKTGSYIVAPRVRYKSEGVAEKFFDYIARLQRMLPDKKKIGDSWYYIYEDTKENRKTVGNEYDVNYWRKTKMLRVPAADGALQALILVDSYPAMLPEKQDVDDPNSAIASQARMFSEQLKRVKGKMRGKRMAVIGINQLRLKPMVMFGCLHASTKIPFTDGSFHSIRDIVENKLKGNVWSYDEKHKALVEKTITAWHYNGDVDSADDWITIQHVCPGTKGGVGSVTVTPDHEIFTDSGWVKAKNLKHSDYILSKYESILTGSLADFVYGCVSSDATIVSDSKVGAILRFQDNENPAYLNWKLEKLGIAFGFKKTSCGSGKTSYTSTRSYELNVLKESIGNRKPWTLKHSPLSVALMYMDDGNYRGNHGCCISYKRFKNSVKSLKKIASIFESFGIYPKISSNGSLRFTVDQADALYDLIADFVPPSMQYKLPQAYHGRYVDFILSFEHTMKPVFEDIVSIVRGSPRKFRSRGKYDISVKDCQNYLAGGASSGMLVHNSPEYETGGEALKLFSDVRMKWSSRALSAVSKDIGEAVKGSGQIEEESCINTKHGVDNYRYIHVRGHKNKLSRPYLESWLRLWITDSKGEAQGFDPVFDTYQYLRTTGQVSGKRAKMVLKFKGNEATTSIGWMDFKRMILGDRATIKSICQSAGMKPVDLRLKCFSQLASGVGIEMFNSTEIASRGAKASKRAEDADTSDGADDNE